jgi:glycine betaine catabolism B
MSPIVIRYSNLEAEFDGTAVLDQNPGQTSWTIGRDETCDLSLPQDHAISGFNSLISFEDGRYWIIDQHSTNGTRVNGSTIQPGQRVPLELRTRIEVGQTTLLIKELEQPASLLATTSSTLNFWHSETLEVECVHIDLESLDTKTFWFATPDRGPYFSYFQPGQFGLVEVTIDGNSHTRAYSISSSPSRPFNLTFTIKRKPDGLVSTYFFERMQVGDRILLKGGPQGSFTCLNPAGELINPKLLLIGAGSGMTPLVSMIRWLYDSVTPDCNVILMQSARTPFDLLFHSELSEIIARKRPEQFRYLATITGDPIGFTWFGLRGRFDSALLQSQIPDLHEREVFCCGPNAFTNAIEAALQDLGFPMAQFHQESFGIDSTPMESVPSRSDSTLALPIKETTIDPRPLMQERQAMGAVNGAVSLAEPTAVTTKDRVLFMDSGESIEVVDNKTILELAEQAGVTIPYSCRVGVCNACKSKVRGEVQYKANCPLSPAEQKDGMVLTCIAKPIGTIEVER